MINKEVLKFASNTKDYGFLENHSHKSYLKSHICGDHIKFYILLKTNKIIQIKYEGSFCIYCQASASLLADYAKNNSIENIKKLIKCSNNFFKEKNSSNIKEWNKFKKIMNNNNVSRKECLLLPLKTLQRALIN